MEKDEFVIATAADLHGLAEIVNGKNEMSSATVYLVNDIQLNAGTANETSFTIASSQTELYYWPGIGKNNSGYRFCGVFDGQMHTISGVVYNITNSNHPSAGFHGFFGALGNSDDPAEIKNFYLTNSFFNFASKNNSGGVVGRMLGGTMENVYSSANVKTTTQIVGGLIGASNTKAITVKNCEFAGTLTGVRSGNAAKIGGIIGASGSGLADLVENCKFSGTIDLSGDTIASSYTGGLVGSMAGTIKNSVSSGDVQLNTAKTNTYYGMVAGTTTGTCENVYTTGSETKITETSRISCTVNASSETYDGIKVVDLSIFALEGLSDDVWFLTEAGPSLKTLYDESELLTLSSDFVSDDTDGKGLLFTIRTADDLHMISGLSVQDTYRFADDTIILANDIVMNEGYSSAWYDKTVAQLDGVREWIPIGGDKASEASFRGTFDGQGYTIRGVFMNNTTSNQRYGFIRQLQGTVKNVRFEDCYFKSQGSKLGTVAGRVNGGTIENVYSNAHLRGSSGNTTRIGFGGIAGELLSAACTISNCHFDGEIRIKNSATTGGNQVGGIIGIVGIDSTITHCLNTGLIRCTGNYNDGDIGGLVGYMSVGTMSYCLNAGTMHDDVYATSRGALIGEVANAPTVTNCYALEGTCLINDVAVLVNGVEVEDLTTVFTDATNVGWFDDAAAENLIATGKWVAGTDYPVPTLAD